MSLFKVKAKVLLGSEDAMEAEGVYDMGNIASSKSWVWRDLSVGYEEVYQITAYDSNKSIVEMYNGNKILVKGTWEELNKKWEDLREKYTNFAHADWVGEESNEQDEDKGD